MRCRAVLPILFAACLAHAQTFEVASIKPAAPGAHGATIRPAPGGLRYEGINTSLKWLIAAAWRVKEAQISGGPAWLETDRFNLEAKAERPSSLAELNGMLRSLLSERFRLQLHRETREMPVYELTLDKGTPKFSSHPADNAGDVWIDPNQDQHPGAFLKNDWRATATSMEYLAYRLAEIMDRPVIDRTDLKGDFDFELAFTRDLPPGIHEGALINGVVIDTSGPNIFEALRKLGLKLDRGKGPVDMIIIDHAEKGAL